VNRHPVTDGWKIAASLFAGPVAVAGLAFVLVAGFAYCAGQRHAVNSISEAALRDTIRLTDSVVRVQTDTLIVYRESSRKAKAASDSVKLLSDSLDRLVAIRDDSSAIVADTVAVVPPEIIADIRGLRLTVAKQDTTIHWLTVENRSLWMRDTTRMKQIDYRDKQLAAIRPPRFSWGASCGVDPFDRARPRCVIGGQLRIK
jgi:hypothetical protein